MANIRVEYIDDIKVMSLMGRRYMVDLHFINQEDFDRAVKLGFDKERWEAKNNNQVIILNGEECYQCQAKLIDEEYGRCRKCFNKEQKWKDDYVKQYAIDNPPTFWDKILKFLR